MFEAFSAEWTKRWDRHLGQDNDQWDPLIQFYCQNTTPGERMHYSPIHLDEWYATLKRKKKRSATGPDGWARMDLLKMPQQITESLLHLLHKIEKGEPWPRSMVTGIIHSLEKIPDASKVTQFRPITTIRAKQLLRHLLPRVPPTCFGNVPNRSASQVWLGIQAEIETANDQGGIVAGAT